MKEDFTAATKEAWTEVYKVLAGTMINSAETADATDGIDYRQMVEGMPIGVMLCDPKTFEITYLNAFSVETLTLTNQGDWGLAALNVFASVGAALVAVWAGQSVARLWS